MVDRCNRVRKVVVINIYILYKRTKLRIGKVLDELVYLKAFSKVIDVFLIDSSKRKGKQSCHGTSSEIIATERVTLIPTQSKTFYTIFPLSLSANSA